jgi:hypothetical protein
MQRAAQGKRKERRSGEEGEKHMGGEGVAQGKGRERRCVTATREKGQERHKEKCVVAELRGGDSGEGELRGGGVRKARGGASRRK